MKLDNLLVLYSLEKSNVLFKHVNSGEMLQFSNYVGEFKLEIQKKYDNDESLIEVLNFLNKIFFKLASSLQPYNQVIDEDMEKAIISKLMLTKKSYPELFSKTLIKAAKSIKDLKESDNNLFDNLCRYINKRAEVGLKVAIVTKRAISHQEKHLVSSSLKSFLKVSYFTENSFRKDFELFDEIIYVGNPLYFGDYVKSTFKGKTITFVSYDIFTNSFQPQNVFEDIDKEGTHSTIYKNVTIGETLQKKSIIEFNQGEVLSTSVNKFLNEQKNEVNSQEAVEACLVQLENDRFLFAPRESKIRVFNPNDKTNLIKQIKFRDVEEDEYIVIRNERDTKLIAEVADQDVLKKSAEKYRLLQKDWKNKLRSNVKRKGLKKVSDILYNKYNIKTASSASVRSWCNEESICPTELTKILKAIKYDENKIKETYETMKKIQNAHIKAGRIISQKLMSELSQDIYKELQEKGFYTFKSKEFDGASFNIERIVSIDRTRHFIAQYNLMKPMSFD
ncbi:hypothetical protein [Rossellomorea sp. FM04394]|uniref:hypothetical protein n=1 Tax=Rossellomorea sp. FM04394 TaxID=3243076 RepID=UPI0035A5860A